MNCSQARELLSALHDNELPPEVETEVEDHLRDCADCAQVSREFGELSNMAVSLRTVSTSPPKWSVVESALDDEHRKRRNSISWRPYIAAAAAIVVLATGILIYSGRHDDHALVARHFGQYLSDFDRTPDGAEQILLANYAGEQVGVEEVTRRLKYEPTLPEVLPGGLSRNRIYLLKMPCCLCTQTIYKDDAGRIVALFEHVDDQPTWFGSRPTITARCHGSTCNVVQLDKDLAASWQRQKRVLTLIGVRDLEELAQLIEYFDKTNQQRKVSGGTIDVTSRWMCLCNGFGLRAIRAF